MTDIMKSDAETARTASRARFAVLLSSAFRSGTVFLLAAVIAGTAIPGGAAAQESLFDQVNRLRRDLEDVQAYLYRSTTVPKSPGGGAQAPESTALLQRQILEMQGQMRDLTGQIEKLRYDIRTVDDRLNKLVGDVDLRLQALERGTAAGNRSEAYPATEPPRGAANALQSPVGAQDTGTTIISSETVTGNPLPPGTKLLGTVNPDAVGSVREGQAPQQGASAAVPATRYAQPAPAPSAAPGPGGVATQTSALPRGGALPEGTAQEQYQYAFKLLQQRNYANAEAALRQFAEKHPTDELTGNALYWLGETFYVRKDFPEAARVFLDAYQRFPKGNKAADNLFKLARSLSEVGENSSSCTTYRELMKSYPNANERILASARGDMSRLNCP